MSRVVGPVAGRASIPSIGHLRDIVGISARAMSDLNENTLVLAVSEATANWHIRHGLSAERTQVLYNGVDMNEFTPRPRTHFLHRELGLANGAVLIGVIGQIVMRKGTDIALEAMKRLATQYATVHLVVAGERNSAKKEAVEFEDRLHAAASQSPLAGRVHFLGYRSDVPRILNELTLLIHAARQEPLGRVLLESAAVGVPVVATNVGGTGEIFPSKEAEIVLPDDAEAIAVAVAELLDDPALVKTRSATAHARIATKFDVRISVRNLLHHYRMLF
jgi:glycosyltransferase involved in cell wall biosynthesis